MQANETQQPADDGRARSAEVERGVGRPVPEHAGLALSGDDNTPAMPMTEAEVNHLRRLLAWMRCEWTLDEDMQRGYLLGAAQCVAHGHATPEQAGAIVAEKAAQVNRCPAYVRQAVKMLTKALRDHEREAGIVDDRKTPNVELSGHQRPAQE